MVTRRLPPLSQLRAFEAAARHRSFKRAAEELSVSAAAISHQIRQLEQRLGVALFERHTRAVVPTAAARSLYPVLRDGFDAFAESIAALAPSPATASVTVSVTPAFAAHWLLPRLPELQRQNPHLDLRILASTTVSDLAAGAADLAVRYGHGPYPQHHAVHLATDRFAPVASPAMGMHTHADLLRQRLIHFDWHQDGPEQPDWPAWLRAADINHDDARAGLRFSDESHAIQAAIAGHGVALLSLTLIQTELERGLLTTPFGPTLPGPGWHLLRHHDVRPRPATQAVWTWLSESFGVPDETARDHDDADRLASRP